MIPPPSTQLQPSLIFPLLRFMNSSVDLKTLLSGVSVKKYHGTTHPTITNLSLHSRSIRSNGLFFAVQGYGQNGLDFVDEAIANGAQAIVTETLLPRLNHIVQVQVPDVREAVARIARTFYQTPDEHLQVVGITGTCGKTSTSWLLHHLYRLGYQEHAGLIGTLHNDLGRRILPSNLTTPDAVTLMSYLREMVTEKLSTAVMEVSSQGIDQKRVDGVHFDTAVFTNLGHDHLDYHHTMDAYYATKRRLFLSSDLKRAVVNVDDPYGQQLLQSLPSTMQVVTIGMHQPADLQATDVQCTGHGITFQLTAKHTRWKIQSPLLGIFNVYNILSALGVLSAQGYDLNPAIRALPRCPTVPGRLERVENPKNIQIFIDFAHKPEALENVLTTLRACTKKKLYVVFGCGGGRDATKRPLMTHLVEQYADHAWATTDNPRFEDQGQIFEDMRQGLQQRHKVDFIEDRTVAVHTALETCEPEDTLLIAGKGTEEMIIMRHQLIPYNDRRTVEAFFEKHAF